MLRLRFSPVLSAQLRPSVEAQLVGSSAAQLCAPRAKLLLWKYPRSRVVSSFFHFGSERLARQQAYRLESNLVSNQFCSEVEA